MSERKTYSVTVLIDASKGRDVEADSPEEAADEALEQIGTPALCHQCSGEIETGDPIGAHVYDGDKLVLDTTWDAQRIAKLTAERDELMAALQEMVDEGPGLFTAINARVLIAKLKPRNGENPVSE